MAEDARARLVRVARLDGRAADVLDGLPDDDIELLLTAWDEAVARQSAEVEDAIEGSLSLLPRLLRGRVMKVLTKGRS